MPAFPVLTADFRCYPPYCQLSQNAGISGSNS
jgi:hypothetical protein